MKLDHDFIIKIRIDNYEDLFYPFDFNEIQYRDLTSELDEFISSKILDLKNPHNFNIILEVYIPELNYSKEKEFLSKKAIESYYDSKVIMDKKIKKISKNRVLYYILLSCLLFICWGIIQNKMGDTFFTTLLDTSSTVILWQAMSVIFIESKNYNIQKDINNIFSNMSVSFKYLK